MVLIEDIRAPSLKWCSSLKIAKFKEAVTSNLFMVEDQTQLLLVPSLLPVPPLLLAPPLLLDPPMLLLKQGDLFNYTAGLMFFMPG